MRVHRFPALGGGQVFTDFPRGVSPGTVESGWGRAQQMRTDPIARGWRRDPRNPGLWGKTRDGVLGGDGGYYGTG